MHCDPTVTSDDQGNLLKGIDNKNVKVTFFIQRTKMQLITLQNFNIQTCFSQFLWFFSLKCWSKGQIITSIHCLMHTNWCVLIEISMDVEFLECDYLLVQWCVKLTLTFEFLDPVNRTGFTVDYCASFLSTLFELVNFNILTKFYNWFYLASS